MPSIPFDRYLRYDEVTAIVQDFATEFPELATLESIGQSYEGREIWLLTLTNKATGPAHEKPAFWCDGNIHASEVSACSAVLMVAHKALTTDEGRKLLDDRALYLVPRLCPDGAEWALEIPPRIVRSSTRPYPYEEDDLYGLEREDLDGDGRILTMRVKDPTGPWKISDLDPRLMRRREPGETGGDYYRLIPEGRFHHFDDLTMRPRRIKEGLDMNRNFPSAWRPENDQFGAGPFPTSEPEIRACVQAIVDRPNICGAITFHTYSGVHLRPPSRMPDDDIPAEDLWTFKKLGEVGEKMTGYPAISNYHEFRYHPKEVITGVFDDWMYEHRGVYAWTTEIWSPQRQAGLKDFKYIDWFREHPHEDDVALLRWSDERLDGKGYVDWRPFNHPQLGEVEIGGWDSFYAFRNPPPQFLEGEIAPLADWAIWQAGCSPKLELVRTIIEPIGNGARIRIAVRNVGWLPTNVTRLGADRKHCRGVRAEIAREGSLDDPHTTPSWLTSGVLRQDAGQLTGWSHVTAGGFGFMTFDSTSDTAVFEWVVGEPGKYEVEVRHDRAGVVRVEIPV